jgi:hypothetical protein
MLVVGAAGEFGHVVGVGAGLDFQNSHQLGADDAGADELGVDELENDIEAGLACRFAAIKPAPSKPPATLAKCLLVTLKSSLFRASRRHPCRTQPVP